MRLDGEQFTILPGGDSRDIAIQIVVRRIVEELARLHPEDDRYRETFLRLCVDDVESARISASGGANPENLRTETIALLADFLSPRRA